MILKNKKMSKYLYGLSIQGIQSYIFETNKLKEIIGASEIVEQICTEILPEIIENNNFDKNKLLLSAAGNVKYIFDDIKILKKVFEEFPQKIKQLSKNINFSQAFIKIETKGVTPDDFNKLEKKIKASRNKPFNKPDLLKMGRILNRRTGFAEEEYKNKTSFDFDTKMKERKKGSELLLNKIDNEGNYIFPKDINEITDSKSKNFIAVIHADGNKLGATIQEVLTSKFIADKSKFLKELSDKIETSTRQAFNIAFEKTIIEKKHYSKKYGQKQVPLRPIILGGDDLTLIIRADLAVSFAKKYLEAFETQTQINFNELLGKDNNNDVGQIKNGLTATAGIVFIKEKYPFHYAANLVESITSYAKNATNRKKSAILFYKVQDAFVNSFNDIAEKELKPNGFDFLSGPYDIEETEQLLDKVYYMGNDDFPKGAIRELLTIMYSDGSKAEFKWERILKINNNNKSFSNIGFAKKLNENKNIYDLITLSSLSTEK